MAKKVYAYTDTVPEGSTYVAGKRYRVISDDGYGFTAYRSKGERGYHLWKGCAHLDGGNWTREEVDETP